MDGSWHQTLAAVDSILEDRTFDRSHQSIPRHSNLLARSTDTAIPNPVRQPENRLGNPPVQQPPTTGAAQVTQTTTLVIVEPSIEFAGDFRIRIAEATELSFEGFSSLPPKESLGYDSRVTFQST